MKQNAQRVGIANARRISLWCIVAVGFLVMMSLAAFSPAVRATGEPAKIWTDKENYYPEENVTIYGINFIVSHDVNITVTRPDSSMDSWNVTSNETGGFTTYYDLDGVFGLYLVEAFDGTNYANTTFWDAEIDFTQCENDHNANGVRDPCFWTTGNLDQQHNIYVEGNAIPQRLFHKISTEGSHTFRIQYDFTKADIYAYDFLTTVDLTQAGSLLNECANLPGFVSSSECASLFSGASTPSIQSDSFDNVASREYPSSRVVKIGGVASASVTIVGHNPSTNCEHNCGTSSVDVDVTFSTTSADQTVALWFAGHAAIAMDPDGSGPASGWGAGYGASSVSGSPFHIKYISLDGGSVGKRDNQVSVGAVQLPGEIIIVKDSVGGDDTFSYTATGAGVPSSFTITTEGGGIGTTGTGSADFVPLDLLTYTFTESSPPSGWDFTSLSCTKDKTSTVTIDGQKVTIVLVAGDVVTCTYTNTKRGHIVVDKVTDPSGDPQSFDFSTTGSGYSSFSLTDEAAANDQLLKPGAYSVTEGSVSGWDLTNLECSTLGGSSISITDSTASITLLAGDTVTCTYTNTGKGNIIVKKVTDPSGDPQSFEFDPSWSTENFLLSDGETHDSGDLDPGTYSVSEVNIPSDWDLESATCTDGTPASMSLQAGETIICTFTNSKRGKIIIDKVTDPSNDDQPFAFELTGGPDNINQQFALTDASTPHDSGYIRHGTYVATELSSLPDWDLTDLVCEGGDATIDMANNKTTIFLDPGETITCTFTNTKRGTVVIVKHSYYADGQFTFTLNSEPQDITVNTLNGYGTNHFKYVLNGDHDVSETVPTNWRLNNSYCSKGSPSNFHLEPGETVTCHFFNEMYGRIIVRKVTQGGDDSFRFYSSWNNSNFYLSNGQSHSSPWLLPDTSYTVHETAKTGWDLTDISCTITTVGSGESTFDTTKPTATITLGAGDTVTCTFTNIKRGTIEVHKYSYEATGTFHFELTGGVFQYRDVTTIGSPTGYGMAAFDDVVSTEVPGQGTYTLTEAAPNGWMLMYAECNDGNSVIIPGVGVTGIVVEPGATVKCTFKNVHKSIVTTSGLCTFDYDSDKIGDQFRLLFTQDPTAPAYYRVTATNPGQFFYNIFVVGVGANQPMTVKVWIPYPFVTQGAMPIHAYGSAQIVASGNEECIIPGNEIFSDDQTITLSNYGLGLPPTGSFGSWVTLTIQFPHEGFAYINIHLDYGLKGTGGWAKQPWLDGKGADAVGQTAPYVGIKIKDFFDYKFSFSLVGDHGNEQIIQNENSFKKNPGFAGQVIVNKNCGSYPQPACGTPVPNAQITVWLGSAWIGTTYTDSDGFYFLPYKHTGKLTMYTVKLTPGTYGVPGLWFGWEYSALDQYVLVKSNAFVWVPPFQVELIEP